MSRSTLEPAAPSARVDIIDPLVVNPGRLCILIALAESEGETDAPLAFTDLRRRTRLSDGNLSCHAQRLATGGLIGIAKQFRDGKPSTTYLLTPTGRRALEAHVQNLLNVVAPKSASALRIAKPSSSGASTHAI